MSIEPTAADPFELKPVVLDSDALPLGERSLRHILNHIIAVGDEAETTYLEVKSSLDLSSKVGVAKVAKFLLGVANRRPNEAARHFRGYAVMVIGAQKGTAAGVPRDVEAHELEDRLRPYLGPQFPAFEFARIGVNPKSEVLFVIGQPPQDGQPPFPCHKDFQADDRKDNLFDGAIYVRGASNTRPARAGDIQFLTERARGGGKPPIELEVSTLGSIGRIDRVDELMERLYDSEEVKFSKTHEAVNSTFSFAVPLSSGHSRRLSAEERVKSLNTWQREKPDHIANGRAHFVGVTLPGVGIQVISRDRFVAKPHLIVTFHDCEVFDFLAADDADPKKVVEPVVRWQTSFDFAYNPAAAGFTSRDYPVAWSNKADDVEVTLTPESFRPNALWQSHQDDYVILARDSRADTVSVTWMLTEDKNDKVTSGAFVVPTGERADAADLFRSDFFNKD